MTFDPLDGLLGFWNSMTHDQRQALTKNLNEFHALRGSLEGRGYIKVDSQMTEVKVLKNSVEVKRLHELLDLTGASTIKWIDKSKKNGA